MTRVLLLTASFGSGHDQAAYALREALENRGAIVKIEDYTDWLHPTIRRFAKFGLLQGVKTVPSLYGLFYRSTSHIPPSSPLNKQLNKLGMSYLKQCIKLFEPNIIAGTFPIPMGVLSELQSADFFSIPNATVITDYTAHPQWVHEFTDLYFVATQSVKKELMELNVPETSIVVSGIPIRSKFHDAKTLLRNKYALRRKHNFEAKTPLVLMMGGGEGLFANHDVIDEIVTSVNAQFVIICGRNESLYRRMSELECTRIQVIGYTEEVHEWMATADLLITKAGGITVTEAFALGLPMLIYRPNPGQEEQNARFAIMSGAAAVAHNSYAAVEFLKSIVIDPSRLVSMREAAHEQVHQNAADYIADELLRLRIKVHT